MALSFFLRDDSEERKLIIWKIFGERVILLTFEWIIGDVAPLLSLNDEIRGREKRSGEGRKIKKKEEWRDKETKQENKDRRKWLS